MLMRSTALFTGTEVGGYQEVGENIFKGMGGVRLGILCVQVLVVRVQSPNAQMQSARVCGVHMQITVSGNGLKI